jgi:hypothetical protein
MNVMAGMNVIYNKYQNKKKVGFTPPNLIILVITIKAKTKIILN